MSDGLWRTLNTWIHGGSSLVAFACDVAVLVAIATIVRRHRPDAYQGLQAWAIGTLGAFLFTTVAWMVLPFLSRPSDGDGLEGYFCMSGLLTILGTVLHVVLVILLIRGLTALAQPPKPIAIEGAPPYR
jgi:hypothetical protein